MTDNYTHAERVRFGAYMVTASLFCSIWLNAPFNFVGLAGLLVFWPDFYRACKYTTPLSKTDQ